MNKYIALTSRIILALALTLSLIAAGFPQAVDPNPPAETVKLAFIHHSTGENWLTDGYGNLGKTLDANNYFVSDTNYGWGPDAIGDRTDIPNWPEWFASSETPRYMEALLNESGQHASYTRTQSNPGGENQIVMFKSCFPNSALAGNPDDPATPGYDLTVGNAKWVYNTILAYFATRPDKLFIVITAPPLSDKEYAANARAFNTWLMDDWLAENGYTGNNVAVFDFYNVLTSPDAHHRVNGGQIEHLTTNRNTLYYPSGDDHPSEKGSRKATDEFVPLLNVFYHRWKATAPSAPDPGPAPATETATQPEVPAPLGQVVGQIDDFESGPPVGASDWEGYYQDNTDTTVTCARDTSIAHSGSASLKFGFDVQANTWTTCGIYYENAVNWQAGQGISFYLRTDQAGLPLELQLFGGSAGGRTLYIYHFTAPAESVDGWALVEIPWSAVTGPEWEAHAGQAFPPNQVTGLAFGLTVPVDARLTGTLWVDDLHLLGTTPAPVTNPTLAPPPATEPITARNPLLPCGSAALAPLAVISGIAWKKRRPLQSKVS